MLSEILNVPRPKLPIPKEFSDKKSVRQLLIEAQWHADDHSKVLGLAEESIAESTSSHGTDEIDPSENDKLRSQTYEIKSTIKSESGEEESIKTTLPVNDLLTPKILSKALSSPEHSDSISNTHIFSLKSKL